MLPPRYFDLIPAAGVGARMGAAFPKQYASLAGKAMLRHVLDTFATHQAITHTFAVVSGDDGYIDDTIRDDATSAGPALAGRVTVVRDGGRPVVDAEDGRWAVVLADALLRAARERRTIELDRVRAR